ncbi:putative CBF/NF-Y-like transcription factor [Hamiltosporidium tvaerminnensis]|uniref:Putative CBF/NF-Y-like transcription factor n=2 Tax=Hamiltosporidium TaxID=1176354 RepID=A0A4Q9KVA7_9MICR|nr:negative cofactor 2 transcription regulator complex subunit ncb2 [Hamiltosporidium tvaerminnensis]TBT98827.1 putative CBF/NF-Y-like transcription factor [Hamiltosporidium magnivora]TBT97860.1 putative CBF/NF-Y-like transcription factor [Hamiltosporidium tvaerminnensis]TBU00394.1 putative CBF/NF-Y-like transcription factor [Hamiltosporidium magnivora]TBU01038.1 putative CBF/NF-Y-like transcription factor [Hamiltosporidium magnivora]
MPSSPTSKREEAILPKGTVNKIIQDTLPKSVSIHKSTKEFIMTCCLEFAHLITAQAAEMCEKESKKTITHEHIFQSLQCLGYSEYVGECTVAHEEYVSHCKMKPSKINKLKTSGLTMEELRKQQLALFESARNEVYRMDCEQNGTSDNNEGDK